MRLTVLICTHDRAALLARAVASLDAAARPADWVVDILVAANACRDGTHDWLAQRAAASAPALPLTWFAEPVPGKSHALNSALPRITADLVAFVDDDHRVDTDYLRAVCAAADAHPQATLLCGRILPDWDGSEPEWVHHDGPYRIYPLPVPRFDLGEQPRELTADVAIPGGGNLAARTTWLPVIGAFSTDMGPTGHDLGGAEDLDWVLRALRLGARLRYEPSMLQYHYVDGRRLTLAYLMRKAYRRTASTIGLGESRLAGGVPRYLYRKLVEYGFKACTAVGSARRRFYLVRTAAALGELAGHRQARRQSRIASQPGNTIQQDIRP
ncbi:MAG TPA: glycosyltransferase family 2 protein [Rubrivivax sp.]|nr:glycosyltransferase family 2 protein [Rubrivivax sp.]